MELVIQSSTCGSDGWRTRKSSCCANFPTTTAHIVQAKGPSFVRKHRPSQRTVCVKLEQQYPAPPCCVQSYFPKFNVPMAAMSRRRAGQRWSALVSAPTSRVAKIIQPVLGESLWFEFLEHATEYYKPAFIEAFNPPSSMLCCVGPADVVPCPHRFKVDLRSSSAAAIMEHLHLDHEQDVQITCDMWVRALRDLPTAPASWDDSIDGGLLCHLLFGVCDGGAYGPAMVRFRCGPSSFGSAAGYCHRLNMPHYRGIRELRI